MKTTLGTDSNPKIIFGGRAIYTFYGISKYMNQVYHNCRRRRTT